MNEFLSFYHLFNVIEPVCTIFVVLSVISLVISIIYITDYSSDQETKSKFKMALLSSVFVLFISIAILSAFSIRMNNLFTKYVANDCKNLKKAALITNDGEYKIKYFEMCVER